MTSKDEAFSLSTVENMLNGINDWRNIQDIVRSTIKSLCDVVRVQGITIREIEKQLSQRISKNELVNCLIQKANVSDVKRSLSELCVSIDSKPSFEQIHSSLEEKVSKAEIQYLLSSKPNLEDIRVMIETKVSSFEYKNEMSNFKHRLDEINEHLIQTCQKFALKDEIFEVKNEIETKANIIDINEALNLKANKESVISALHKKVNKTEYDDAIKKKVDNLEYINFIQNYENNKVLISEFKRLSQVVEGKCDKNEMSLLSTKADIKDLEFLSKTIGEIKLSMSSKIIEIDQDVNLLIENLKKEFQDTNAQIKEIDAKKVDFKELEKINTSINKKIDAEKLNISLSQIKNDIFECFKHYKTDLNQNKKMFEDSIKDKINSFNKLIDKQNEDILKYKDKIIQLNDNRKSDQDEILNEARKIYLNFSKEISVEQTSLRNEMIKIIKGLEDIIINTKNEFEMTRSQLNSELDNKAGIESLDNLFKSIENNISSKFTEKNNLNHILKKVESEIYSEISKKADFDLVQNMLESKVDSNALTNYLSLKVNQKDYENLRNQMEILIKELSNKIGNELFNKYLNEIRISHDEIQKDLVLKANFNEILVILKNKAEIDEVNKALKQVHCKLDFKTDEEKVNFLLKKV